MSREIKGIELSRKDGGLGEVIEVRRRMRNVNSVIFKVGII